MEATPLLDIVTRRPWPAVLRGEQGLRQLGRQLRERHARAPRAPRPAGYLDWELSGARSPLIDLCQLTWAIAPISLRPFSEFGFRAEPDRLRRIEGLCEAYGVDPEIVLLAAPECMRTAARRLERRSATGAAELRETIDWYLGWLKR
ncbi:hypothetical protein [Longispora sp. NPDC051575]|uniref:hypothetical protein n=1 Tax=Longispora sp. NPDC051575 TaxID=3154943 RepID=UPI00342D96BE